MSATRRRHKSCRKHQIATERAEHQRELAAQQERHDEAIAPAAQRQSVVTPDGQVLRGPRIERSGITFILTNPIRNMIIRSRHRRADSDLPAITEWHAAASERLLRAHDLAGEGIGIGHSDYSRGGVSSAPQTGYLSKATISAITRQAQAAEERARAKEWLGPVHWAPISACVLRGISFAAWAQTRPCRRAEALGDLVRALDALVEFYPAIHRHATAALSAYQAARQSEPPPASP